MKKQPREALRAVHRTQSFTLRELQQQLIVPTHRQPLQERFVVTMKDWRALSLAGGRLFLGYAPAKVNRENHRQSWRPPEDEPVMSTQAI